LKSPSKLQQTAIRHYEGPAEVIAGPGSGKTTTIIQRILFLVYQRGISPSKILVITYTKAAAAEMKSRYQQAAGEFLHSGKKEPDQEKACEGVQFGTFHSICWNILRSSSLKQLSLIGEREKRELIQTLLCNLGLGGNHLYDIASAVLNEISREKNLIGYEQSKEKWSAAALSGEVPYEEYLKIKRGYEQYLREQEMVDFDDMIMDCLKLFTIHPEVLKRYQQQFEYILADEFQDINFPQYQILKLLTAPGNNLFVVGDDDQAIYGFRGATPGIMKQFLEDYPMGRRILLTENYRSGEKIVSLAGKVIRRNQERFEKEFLPIKKGGRVRLTCFDTRKQEEEALIENLRKLSGRELSETAVIVRTNMSAAQYGELLAGSGIAVKGSQRQKNTVFHSFIMEDILSFLSFVYLGNKRRDLLGFMNKPNRFLLREALTEETVTLMQLQQYYRNNKGMQKRMEDFWRELMLAGSLGTSMAVSLFRNILGYNDYLDQKAADAGWKSIYRKQADQIQEYLKDYVPGTDLRHFVEQKEKSLGEGKEHFLSEGVSVLTMHSAKGLEFDRVWLPDVNQGIMPDRKCTTDAALEEERRLLYVAITRARWELTIYYTRERGRKLSPYLEGLIPHQ